MKPMLAKAITEEDLKLLKYPLIAQPKLDGIRCMVIGGEAYSRTGKLIPNRFIRNALRENWWSHGYHFLDGELLLRPDKPFNEVSSAIMSMSGTPNFRYVVFDGAKTPRDLHREYTFRFDDVVRKLSSISSCVEPCPERLVNSASDALDAHESNISRGLEGTIFRSILGKYKQGRSTLKEGYLLKLKPMLSGEGTIIGFEQLQHNDNTPTRNSLGNLERSSHQANLIGGNTLGAVVVEQLGDSYQGQIDKITTFKIGTGFTQEQRQEIWNNKLKYLGKTIKFKYQEKGTLNKPRCPVMTEIIT